MDRINRYPFGKWLLALVLMAIFGSSILQRYAGNTLDNPNLDFYDYYFAAHIVRDAPHANLYEGATGTNPQLRSAPEGSALSVRAKQAGLSDIEMYLYPPLFADLMVPLTALPPQHAAAAWRLLNLLLAAFSMWLIARLLHLPLLSFEFAVLLVAGYSFWPVHESIALGQISILMLAIWAIGVVAYSESWLILSGAAFALGTALKITPALLVPLFILYKERRWLLSYAITLAGLSGIMLTVNGVSNLQIYTQVVKVMSAPVPAAQNKSLSSVFCWIFYGRVFSLGEVHAVLNHPKPALTLLLKIASGIIYLSALLLLWKRNSDDLHGRTKMLAILSLLIMTISPVSWRHGYTVALIPFAMLWNEVGRKKEASFGIILLFLATFTVGTLFFDLAARAAIPSFLQILCDSSWPVLCLLLCFHVLWKKHSGPLQTSSLGHPI